MKEDMTGDFIRGLQTNVLIIESFTHWFLWVPGVIKKRNRQAVDESQDETISKTIVCFPFIDLFKLETIDGWILDIFQD